MSYQGVQNGFLNFLFRVLFSDLFTAFLITWFIKKNGDSDLRAKIPTFHNYTIDGKAFKGIYFKNGIAEGTRVIY